MTDRILVEHSDEITTLTINRPDRKNSFDPDLVVEFQEVLRQVDLDERSKVIVVTGAGDCFSAGGDIKAFGSKPDPRVLRRGWHLVHTMLDVEKPMIAMINGPALGLGLTIALLCDCTVMAEDARLGDPHVSVGLTAGDGGAVVLPLLIGPHRAKELLMSGRSISGTEAEAMGAVNRVVPASELRTVTYELAAEFAQQPVYATRATKVVVNRYVRWMADQVLDVALAYEAISRELPEHGDAVRQWRERRAKS